MEDNRHQFQSEGGGDLPIPLLDPHFGLFSENDQIDPILIDVDFPLNLDIDFSFDDLSFADDLLLEQPDPISDPDSDPLILSSGISQDWAVKANSENSGSNQNVDGGIRVYGESVSSEASNSRGKCDSPEIDSSKSNSGVFSGKPIDLDVSSSLLIVNDHNNNDNSDEKRSRLSRKTIKLEPAKIRNRDNKDSTSSGSGSDCVSKCVTKSKRKMEDEKDHSDETRSTKFRRFNVVVNANGDNIDASVGGEGEGDDKRKARLIRNRESAQLSRQRKKHYVEVLEDKVRAMHLTITDLNSRISYFMNENATLRQQLTGGCSGGVTGPGVQFQAPGMYPVAPYPWMPYPPAYMVRPQGTHVPLVPIPRLKPQPPVSASKVKKSSEEKTEKKKDKIGRKTKKVASVSLLGLLFCMFLFGGLLPMVNVRYGHVGDGFSEGKQGTVFRVDKEVGKVGDGHRRVLQESNNSSGGNGSEPLVASNVPRNDKLVKIDGNLIIHSILASEKATASRIDKGAMVKEETSLAIHGSYPPYPTPGPGSNNWRRPHLDRNQDGRQRALGSGSSDFTPAGSDGKLQQWFREGLAGPMLSSGMCTEVFQFDVSPTPGSIIPAASVSNITSKDHLNSTRPNIPRNRRILHGHAIPLNNNGETLNHTEKHFQSHEPPNEGLESNKSRSSVVVSVLVDPREVGDGGDGDGVIGSKTLPRIFVVVLIDSVKYVTYSCMLPFMGSGSHLITA